MPKKYRKSKNEKMNGYSVRVGEAFKIKDGRHKRVATLLDFEGVRIGKDAQIYGRDEEELEKNTQESLKKLILEHGHVAFSRLTKVSEPVLMLRDYAAARQNDIAGYGKWAGKAEENWKCWDEILLGHFGGINLFACHTSDVLEKRMEDMTHQKRSKRSLTDDEKRYWIILSDILACAVNEDELLASNPLTGIANECRKSMSTAASKDLARRNLDDQELENLLDTDWRHSESSIEVMMDIQVLSGMTVAELCALNTEDVVEGEYVCWIQVTKSYTQVRRQQPQMNYLLEDANAYRKSVCTEVMEVLLKHQIASQKKKAAAGMVRVEVDDTTQKPVLPLFTDATGARMLPDVYKAAVKKKLDDLVHDGAVLYFRKRGSALHGEDKPTMASTDWLRETAEYYFRNVCGMNAYEVAAMMGTHRMRTVAIYYIDWHSELQMLYMKAKINQWHGRLAGVLGVSGNVVCGRAGCLCQVIGKR